MGMRNLYQNVLLCSFLLVLFSIVEQSFGFLEESEVNPEERTCDPSETKKAQECENSMTILSATYASIQGQHPNLGASDHIGINKNCKAALSCLKKYIGCSQITQQTVDDAQAKCDYMSYLTGAFYPCSQTLNLLKEDIKCISDFFDIGTPSKDTEKCDLWKKNRACVKWTIRNECEGNFWEQYRLHWKRRSDLMKCN